MLCEPQTLIRSSWVVGWVIRRTSQVPTTSHDLINVFVCDTGNKLAAETVLLLHGLGTSSFIWRKVSGLKQELSGFFFVMDGTFYVARRLLYIVPSG